MLKNAKHRTQDQKTGGTPKVPYTIRYSQQILRKPREGKYNHILFAIIIKNKHKTIAPKTLQSPITSKTSEINA